MDQKKPQTQVVIVGDESSSLVLKWPPGAGYVDAAKARLDINQYGQAFGFTLDGEAVKRLRLALKLIREG